MHKLLVRGGVEKFIFHGAESDKKRLILHPKAAKSGLLCHLSISMEPHPRLVRLPGLGNGNGGCLVKQQWLEPPRHLTRVKLFRGNTFQQFFALKVRSTFGRFCLPQQVFFALKAKRRSRAEEAASVVFATDFTYSTQGVAKLYPRCSQVLPKV